MDDRDDTEGGSLHFLQFFEDDRARYDAVSAFSTPLLVRGGAVFIVAAVAHGRRFDELLRQLGFDVDGLKACGQLRIVDADEVLTAFMASSAPDAAKFLDSVGGIIRHMEACHPKVGVYEEMADILWARGNRYGALELESLWNDLMAAHRFTLLCGYAQERFAHPEDEMYRREVCALHVQTALVSDGSMARVRDYGAGW